MSDSRSSRAGLGALLTPDNCALILIDHQPFQFAGLRSHDTRTIINNVVGLAKSAKAFNVPTLLTTNWRPRLKAWPHAALRPPSEELQ